ncbi:MAG: hypothetical protein Q7S33_04570 [Nanoarchaeota archaeon]|nr:hypothetical protein [Nanoarchaeota archaeon]
MISKTIELENTPFVRAFTLAILKTIYYNKLATIYEKKDVINADLVPKISERTGYASSILDNDDLEKYDFSKLIEPLPIPKSLPNMQIISQNPKMDLTVQRQSFVAPAPRNFLVPSGKFGKIDFFLKDPSVSIIDCPGAGKNIIIIRNGQKTFTKISLSPNEINDILQIISAEAKVPLLEGFFRVAVENFVVHSIISSTVGSRFIIKKQNPFDLLESWEKERNLKEGNFSTVYNQRF